MDMLKVKSQVEKVIAATQKDCRQVEELELGLNCRYYNTFAIIEELERGL